MIWTNEQIDLLGVFSIIAVSHFCCMILFITVQFSYENILWNEKLYASHTLSKSSQQYCLLHAASIHIHYHDLYVLFNMDVLCCSVVSFKIFAPGKHQESLQRWIAESIDSTFIFFCILYKTPLVVQAIWNECITYINFNIIQWNLCNLTLSLWWSTNSHHEILLFLMLRPFFEKGDSSLRSSRRYFYLVISH